MIKTVLLLQFYKPNKNLFDWFLASKQHFILELFSLKIAYKNVTFKTMVNNNTIYIYGGVFIPNFYLSYIYKYLIKWCQDSGKEITKSKARSSTRPLSKTVFPLNPLLLITLIIVQSGFISIISIKIYPTQIYVRILWQRLKLKVLRHLTSL